MKHLFSQDTFQKIADRKGRVSGFAAGDFLSDALCGLILNPDRLFQDTNSTILKQMGNTHTLRFSCEGKEFFFKHYLSRGWGQSMRARFGGSRGRRAWKRAELFRAGGVPTPKPIAILEKRRLSVPVESYLLYEYHAGLETLYQEYQRLGEDVFCGQGLLSRIGEDVLKMHDAGLFHGDLKWSNILVSEETKGIQLLIDLDGAGKLNFRREVKMAMDISRFLVDLCEVMERKSSGMKMFLLGYFGESKAGGKKCSRLLSLVERQMIVRLRKNGRARGHGIRLKEGEITGLLKEMV